MLSKRKQKNSKYKKQNFFLSNVIETLSIQPEFLEQLNAIIKNENPEQVNRYFFSKNRTFNFDIFYYFRRNSKLILVHLMIEIVSVGGYMIFLQFFLGFIAFV